MPAKKRQFKQSIVAHSLQEAAKQRVLQREVDRFEPDHLDYLIVEAIFNGEFAIKALQKYTEASAATLRKRLSDPVRAMWMSQKLDRMLAANLGKVHTSVFLAALATGDPARARYLDQLYDQGPKAIQRHLHLHAAVDLRQMSDDQLEKFVKEKSRELGLKE